MVKTRRHKNAIEISAIWEQQILPSLMSMRNIVSRANEPIYSQTLANLAKQLQRIRINQTQMSTDIEQNQINELFALHEKTQDLTEQANSSIQKLLLVQQQQVLGGISEVTKRISRLAIMDWSFLSAGIILCAMLVLLLTRFITRPIYRLVEITKELARGKLDQQIDVTGTLELDALSDALRETVQTFQALANVTENMARGDYTARVNVKSHEDRLAITVNQMLDNFTQIIRQADSIAEGNYSTDIKPRSEKDILGSALQNMTIKLRQHKQRTDDESWIKDGLTQFAAEISGCHDLHQLCEKSISNICRYIHAGLGTIYLYHEEPQELSLSGAYALYELRNSCQHYKLGQGIIGQVAKEHKPVLLKNVPKQIHTISSGSLHISPAQIYVIPIIYESTLLAIMEIGVIEAMSDIQQYYMEQINHIFASQLNSAKQQSLTKQLLNESKLLAEKLQLQQEELRTANEELEQQTEILKASEDELRRKDEAQKQINRELEERNITLEKQKTEIEQKTIEIQKAGLELKEKAEELERASQYKSDFLANMSHELRTPLNSLLILAKMFTENEEGNLTEDQLDSASIMLKSGEDLLTLINDILDLAKVEAGKIELYYSINYLDAIIGNCQRNFNHVARNKNIVLKTQLAGNLPDAIYTDEIRLTQIIRNLVSNAIKFTDHGSVTISVHRPTIETDLSVSQLALNKTIAFSVIDTGIGIAKDKQSLIFGSFQQADGSTSRKYGGTGLGLSISLQFAKLLGGEIQLQSIENVGSTFTLYIPEKPIPQEVQLTHTDHEVKSVTINNPSSEDDLSKNQNSHTKPVSPQDEKKVLLVIEDDEQFARILINYSHKKGFKCIHANNGTQGLVMAIQSKPNGILLDLGLPGIDGLTLLDKLKSNPETCNIPVHVISANEKKSDALQKGAIGYLTKPINKLQLDNAIHKIELATSHNIKNLLITEDDENTLQAVKKLFSEKGINVSIAINGAETLEKLQQQQFDCLILDLGLPDMSGQELLEDFYNSNPLKIPAIIIYTGKHLKNDESEKLSQYVDSIIIKGTDTSVDKLMSETTLFLNQIETKTKPLALTLTNNELKSDKPPIKRSEIKAKLENKVILLVDDDMRNSFALSKSLRNKGCEVIMAANGQKAVDACETNKKIDMVLMDIMMPIMDGYQAMSLIRKISGLDTLPIIALTAKAMKGDYQKCIAAGASDFLCKPVDTDKLFELMARWL